MTLPRTIHRYTGPGHLNPSTVCVEQREDGEIWLVARAEGRFDQVEIWLPRQQVTLLYRALLREIVPTTET